MKISKTAQAGKAEASDILITLMPSEEKGIKVELQSKKVILKQFGTQIEKVIRDTVQKAGLEDVLVQAKDNGALDYTIRARVETAIRRAL
jgi:citrate lyase subunit gamma (acyl carrier protein)